MLKHEILGYRTFLLIACWLALVDSRNVRAATSSIDLSSAAGVKWEFKPEGADWGPIQVPAGGWRTQNLTCDAGTYRTWITLPKDAGNRRIHLAFDAINFGAKIYAGKDESSLTPVAEHVDGWVPVTADITPLAHAGEKVLIQVAVAGRRKFMVNGKFTVPEGASWCPGIEDGILRGVHLLFLPPVRVDDAFIQTSLAPDTLHPLVTLVNDTAASADVTLSSKIDSASGANLTYPNVPDVTVTLPPQSTRVVDLGQIPWTAGAESYWWPNVPYRHNYRAPLHNFHVTVNVAGQTVQDYAKRFGFRQFRAVGDHYELNGVRCNLRGDNQQEANFGTDAYGIKKGFGPPTSDNPGWPQAVDNLLRLNFNVMRIHQIPATPYMLDVCDEKGLMLVDESPLRGSENKEDYQAGKTNMLNMDRELVLRDRNHPCVVIWSAANEWSAPIRDAMPVIRAVDPTRVIIADGIGDMGPDVINMQHYVDGIGQMPRRGGKARKDRPYGETEAIWANDSSWQGFAWMGTSILERRLEGDSDLRNYVLNNAWSNYVPGEGPETEILESKVKNYGWWNKKICPPLNDPWNNHLIRLLQRCCNPLVAFDTEFDSLNAPSNQNGDWPIASPIIPTASHVERELAVFNDDFSGKDVTLRWKLLSSGKATLAQGEIPLHIPLGQFVKQKIAFDTPKEPGTIVLVLSVRKDGEERFADDHTSYNVLIPQETIPVKP